MDEAIKALQKKSLKAFRDELPEIERNLLWEQKIKSIKDALDVFHYVGFEAGYKAGKESAK